jgi:hypothetical protein
MGSKPGEVEVLLWLGSAVPVSDEKLTDAQEQLRIRIARIIAMRRGGACLGIGVYALIIICI